MFLVGKLSPKGAQSAPRHPGLDVLKPESCLHSPVKEMSKKDGIQQINQRSTTPASVATTGIFIPSRLGPIYTTHNSLKYGVTGDISKGLR
jgi:hypothetical protein